MRLSNDRALKCDRNRVMPGGRHALRRRGLSALGVMFFLALIGIFVLAHFLRDDSMRRERRIVAKAQEDPETLLLRFFIEREKVDKPNKEMWDSIMPLMSRDDRDWFEQHYPRIAPLNPRTEGVIAMAVTPREQKYSALEYLMRSMPYSRERPVFVRAAVDADNRYGVAYVHPPGNAQAMQEVFIIREDGLWKIRRFLGARDTNHLMAELIEHKRVNDIPLSADEQDYKDDPGGYAKRKRAALLAEVGLSVEKASP